jgi:hypothetical protein
MNKLKDFIVSYCERRGIATRETLGIGFGVCLCCLYTLFAWYIHEYLLELGSSLLYYGGLANLYVISCNGNQMPTPVDDEMLSKLRTALPSRGICQLGNETKLAWLSDKYLIKFWGNRSYYVSIGDFVALFGAILSTVALIIRLKTLV